MTSASTWAVDIPMVPIRFMGYCKYQVCALSCISVILQSKMKRGRKKRSLSRRAEIWFKALQTCLLWEWTAEEIFHG